MKSIGVCIVINDTDGLYATKYFIENFAYTIKDTNINAYILSNGNGSGRAELFKSISSIFCNQLENPIKTENFIELNEKINIYSAYNKLMPMVKEQYTCLLPNGTILNEHWYLSLLNSYDKIKNSGIISIKTGLDKTHITSTLTDNDTMEIICRPDNEDEVLKGPLFIDSELIKVIGGFENNLIGTGYEEEEFFWRYRMNYHVNYYVLKQNCIETMTYQKIKTDEGKKLFKEELKNKIKSKVYKSKF